jgi:hypothetical protein
VPGSTVTRRERLIGERPTMRLWHYTCADAAPLIRDAGVLVPNAAQTWLPEPVVWATDLLPGDVPDLDLALGLRGQWVTCDRTEFRFEVIEVAAFEPWTVYARRQVRAGALDRDARALLDSTPGGWPRHWWVSPLTVRILPVDIRCRRSTASGA